MHTLAQLYIFENTPKEQRTLAQAGWWRNMPLRKQVPYAFARSFQLGSDALLLSVSVLISATTHAPVITIAGLELLFIAAWTLQVIARGFKHFLPVVGAYLAIIGLGIILNLVFPQAWGSVMLYAICVIVFYRFPPRWSLPFAIISAFALITTDGALRLLLVTHPANLGTLAFNLAIACISCWIGWTRRTQCLLVMKLHEVQEQLREQMAHSAELATERERTRIARDIHDVLSHSLAVLSIQVQAARHLITRDPERLAAKLDEMATLIRESITESRHVVGLLREKPSTLFGQDDLGASLRSIATTFNERTGIHCHIEETGVPHKLNPQQRETLQLALREMLTNAHRHGAAQTAWIKWRWRETSILLEIRDDGAGAQAVSTATSAQETSNRASGHHGLQGMRERVAALGGEVETISGEAGGFTVTLRLPFASASNGSYPEGKPS